MRLSSPSSNDIVALGELLIDFTENGLSKTGGRLFEQNPGGAPANMLTAATRLGSKTALIGKVGKDMHGEFLKKTLIDVGIDTSGLILDELVFTTLAFVALSDKGEREFSFARKPGADTCLSLEEINYDLIANSRIFHFGSLSLTDNPSREATKAALEFAKSKGLIVTYDPNYRASLWSNEKTAIDMMKRHLEDVNIIKIADNEFHMITNEKDFKKGTQKLHNLGIECVVVTLGDEGAYVSVQGEGLIVGVPEVKVVDTTGAGDAFFGGFLNQFLKSKLSLDTLTINDAKEFAYYGNVVAALCITRRGAIPAMPNEEEVEKFIRGNYVR